MWRDVQLQVDVLAFAVGLGSLIVSSYIALLLHRLSRKFSQNEAIRSINERWDTFHVTMLNAEIHGLFWDFVKSETPFTNLGERAHHIVLMYLNNIHTEYYTYQNRIFPDYDLNYIDALLKVLVPKRNDIMRLANASGYDAKFEHFLWERLCHLAKEPTTTGDKGVPARS